MFLESLNTLLVLLLISKFWEFWPRVEWLSLFRTSRLTIPFILIGAFRFSENEFSGLVYFLLFDLKILEKDFLFEEFLQPKNWLDLEI